MSMTEKQFRECLMLYGAYIANWPKQIQAEALRVSIEPAMHALISEQRYFEKLLRDNDVVEPAGPWLADRIINAAKNKGAGISITAWVQELLEFLLPQPAFALATVLVVGIVIGFSLPAATGKNNTTPAFFEDTTL